MFVGACYSFSVCRTVMVFDDVFSLVVELDGVCWRVLVFDDVCYSV